MADKATFTVVRRHLGDRMYEVGETREGSKAELKHLIPHVLEEVAGAKAERAPQNKAEPAAPQNKVEADETAAKGVRARRSTGERS
jgi:hypothetical protein